MKTCISVVTLAWVVGTVGTTWAGEKSARLKIQGSWVFDAEASRKDPRTQAFLKAQPKDGPALLKMLETAVLEISADKLKMTLAGETEVATYKVLQERGNVVLVETKDATDDKVGKTRFTLSDDGSRLAEVDLNDEAPFALFFKRSDSKAAGKGEPEKATLQAGLRKGLVLHYTFDDKRDGQNVADKSGRNNHGVARGATWGTDGKRGGVFEFDGRNDCIRTAADFLRNAKFSLLVWMRVSPGGGAAQMVVQTGNGTITYLRDRKIIRVVAFKDRRGGSTTGVATRYYCDTGKLDIAGTWAHVAFVVSTNNTMACYPPFSPWQERARRCVGG